MDLLVKGATEGEKKWQNSSKVVISFVVSEVRPVREERRREFIFRWRVEVGSFDSGL